MVARVLLCDQNAFSRIGLRTVLGAYPSIDVVAESGTGTDALAAAVRLRPDVVLADLALPGMDGIELTRQVLTRAACTNGAWTPSMVLMTPRMDDAVLGALRAGAAGILVKECEADEFVRAIDVILNGGGFLAPQVVRHLVNHMSGATATSAGSTAAGALTDREREVLALLADGLSNVEIGARLFVGEPTVKYHISQLLRKLNLRDRLQAAAFAYKNGLVGWR
jgi:DNA-binding NarL/FixJ family response regulator